MRNIETKGIMVNYYIPTQDMKIAWTTRNDVKETIHSFALLKELEADVKFNGEDGIDFVKNGLRAEVADKVYRVEDYQVVLPTNIDLFCIDVYLEEKY